MTWAAGVATGAFAAAWGVIRDEPPDYIEHWREGADGERKTAEALKPLEQLGLWVTHDVQMRYGNYDHIAVGRAGVFLLETKNPNGIVELRGGVPYVRRRLDPEAHNRDDRIRPRALSAAVRLNEDIAERTGYRSWVQAVVVFWADFPEGVVDDGRCIFLHGSRLQAWMRSRPDAFDQGKADEIAAAVESTAATELSALAADAADPSAPNVSQR